MNLENATVRVSVETKEQFEAACACPGIELIYVDAGFFAKEDPAALCQKARKGTGGIGKLCGLRLPKVWREEAETYFAGQKEKIREAGFDCFLAPSLEGALWLLEEGFTESGENVILDHSVYSFNSRTDGSLSLLSGLPKARGTFSLEMSFPEMKTQESGPFGKELVVYGRVPMMVTAQCIRRTSLRCDKRMCTMKLKDRTGAFLPVKNNCTFCYNTIYNSVPTVLYDWTDEIFKIGPASVRYEFTVETGEELKNVIRGMVPKSFTRGHFRKGVM